jgi:hypothetical protein
VEAFKFWLSFYKSQPNFRLGSIQKSPIDQIEMQIHANISPTLRLCFLEKNS